MHQNLFSFLVLLASLQAHAEPLVYKSWKVFESDYGYEFKYPDCWKVGVNNAYDEGPLLESMDVITQEESCKTRKLDPEVPNGVSFAAGSKIDSKKREKRIALEASHVAKQTYYLVSTRRAVDGDAELFSNVEYTDKLKNTYRWSATLFCPERIIEITGPTIKDPDKALLEKFKKGDLAIPEPYKTIFDSVKCTKDRK